MFDFLGGLAIGVTLGAYVMLVWHLLRCPRYADPPTPPTGGGLPVPIELLDDYRRAA